MFNVYSWPDSRFQITDQSASSSSSSSCTVSSATTAQIAPNNIGFNNSHSHHVASEECSQHYHNNGHKNTHNNSNNNANGIVTASNNSSLVTAANNGGIVTGIANDDVSYSQLTASVAASVPLARQSAEYPSTSTNHTAVDAGSNVSWANSITDFLLADSTLDCDIEWAWPTPPQAKYPRPVEQTSGPIQDNDRQVIVACDPFRENTVLPSKSFNATVPQNSNRSHTFTPQHPQLCDFNNNSKNNNYNNNNFIADKAVSNKVLKIGPNNTSAPGVSNCQPPFAQNVLLSSGKFSLTPNPYSPTNAPGQPYKYAHFRPTHAYNNRGKIGMSYHPAPSNINNNLAKLMPQWIRAAHTSGQGINQQIAQAYHGFHQASKAQSGNLNGASHYRPYCPSLPGFPGNTMSSNSTGRRRGGGRRPDNSKMLTQEDEDKRVLRRQRNKEAAARCRKRRQDTIDNLTLQVTELTTHKQQLEQELQLIEQERQTLMNFLQSHNCVAGDDELHSQLSAISSVFEQQQRAAEANLERMLARHAAQREQVALDAGQSDQISPASTPPLSRAGGDQLSHHQTLADGTISPASSTLSQLDDHKMTIEMTDLPPEQRYTRMQVSTSLANNVLLNNHQSTISPANGTNVDHFLNSQQQHQAETSPSSYFTELSKSVKNEQRPEVAAAAASNLQQINLPGNSIQATGAPIDSSANNILSLSDNAVLSVIDSVRGRDDAKTIRYATVVSEALGPNGGKNNNKANVVVVQPEQVLDTSRLMTVLTSADSHFITGAGNNKPNPAQYTLVGLHGAAQETSTNAALVPGILTNNAQTNLTNADTFFRQQNVVNQVPFNNASNKDDGDSVKEETAEPNSAGNQAAANSAAPSSHIPQQTTGTYTAIGVRGITDTSNTAEPASNNNSVLRPKSLYLQLQATTKTGDKAQEESGDGKVSIPTPPTAGYGGSGGFTATMFLPGGPNFKHLTAHKLLDDKSGYTPTAEQAGGGSLTPLLSSVAGFVSPPSLPSSSSDSNALGETGTPGSSIGSSILLPSPTKPTATSDPDKKLLLLSNQGGGKIDTKTAEVLDTPVISMGRSELTKKFAGL